MSEVLSLEQARAAGIGDDLEDDALQAAIDEEEAWLARRIGRLVGERVERLALAYLRPQGSEVHLRRPTDAVTATVGDTEAEVTLLGNGWRVFAVPAGSRFRDVLELTYTPTDELEVRRALKALVQLTVTGQAAGGITGETIGTYSYQRAQSREAAARAAILASLREPTEAGSNRLRSSVGHGLAGALER